MAILKAINVKSAGRNKLLATLDYVANPKKNNDPSSKTDNFKRQTLVNRMLQGQRTRKRQFKQYVLAMKEEWPDDTIEREKYEAALKRVSDKYVLYFMKQGYIAQQWVHHNTRYPHCHLLLECCNAFSGKQYSESPSDLKEMKRFLNQQLRNHKFEEQILGDLKMVSEELLFEEGEDVWYEQTVSERPCEKNDYKMDTGIFAWNIGTDGTNIAPLREMCTIVKSDESFGNGTLAGNSNSISVENRMAARENKTSWNDMTLREQNPTLKEMCVIVKKDMPLKEMCVIANKNHSLKEMCTIIEEDRYPYGSWRNLVTNCK